MAPHWRIRREWSGSSYLWRVYRYGQRHTAFWTWPRCIEYVDQIERSHRMAANYGGRL